MSLYQAMVNRFVTPAIAEFKAGLRDWVYEKEYAEGRAEADAAWRAWNKRRINARTHGQPWPGRRKTATNPTR